MIRRLYFLFPSPAKTLEAVEELIQSGVNKTHMHALAREGVNLAGLPPCTAQQRHKLRELIARLFWDTELSVFFFALAGLVFALIQGYVIAALVALLVMAATFLSGAFYAVRIPDNTLVEFSGALAHGEVLLMVDVPKQKVAGIEDIIHRHHPAAIAGGSSWTIDAMGI
jgi:hypothetical protein